MENNKFNNYIDISLVLDDDFSSFDEEKQKKKKNTYKILGIVYTVIIYLILIFFAFLALLPFYWMIITSLKSESEVQLVNPTFFPIQGLYFSNFIDALARFDFLTYFLNTVVVIVFSTFGTLITTILSAFAFARLEFKGKTVLFNIFLATMMIPSELLVITNYITCYKLGLLNGGRIESYLAIMLPYIVNVFSIFLLRQNFKQVSNELYLASKVDGKSDWSFLWKVMVPISSPTIITIIVMKIISTWNAYAWPKMVASSNSENYLITVGLSMTQFVDEGGLRELASLEMAGAFIVTIPLIILFIIFRKYIMRGVGKAGIKG